MLIANVIDTNSKATNAMLGNSQGFNVFFFIWSIFQLIYGFNAIFTTNKINQVNRDALSKWRSIIKKQNAKK